MFPVWRYHPFFTNTTLPTAEADITHRRHATIETTFADLIDGPLAHIFDERTSVSYRDGMDAALKLAEAVRKDEGAHERAQLMAQMGRIIEVVRTFIPAERWPDVQAALRGEQRHKYEEISRPAGSPLGNSVACN